MLNGTFVNGQAKLFAESVTREAGADEQSQARLVLRRVLQRVPTQPEVERGVRFMADLRAGTSSRPRRRCGVSACWP